jgi:hypothetical protein
MHTRQRAVLVAIVQWGHRYLPHRHIVQPHCARKLTKGRRRVHVGRMRTDRSVRLLYPPDLPIKHEGGPMGDVHTCVRTTKSVSCVPFHREKASSTVCRPPAL